MHKRDIHIKVKYSIPKTIMIILADAEYIYLFGKDFFYCCENDIPTKTAEYIQDEIVNIEDSASNIKIIGNELQYFN